MKLLIENWRKFIKEAKELVSQSRSIKRSVLDVLCFDSSVAVLGV